MKEYVNSDAKIVSIMVPEELVEMSDRFDLAFNSNMGIARLRKVSLIFSPSSQRAALLSKQMYGSEEDIRKVFPKYGWSVEQEAKAMPGVVVVPDEKTSPNQLSARVSELIGQFN